MKKSTLITTIAMIVVVVVALSTATYAWFTSDSKTYASQTISTVAAADIVVLANGTRMLATNTKATFTEQALLTYTIGSTQTENDLGIRKGLWAPTSQIASVASGSNSATDSSTSVIVSYIAGTQSSDGTTFTVSTAPTDTSADMIRVTAMKAGSIDLTIIIGAADGEASLFAAQGVSFYLASATAKMANTKYSYFDTNHASYALTKGANNEGGANVVEANDTTVIANSFTAVDAYGTITDSASANHRVTSTTPGTGFTTNVADTIADKAGIAYGTYTKYYTMTVSLGDAFAQNESRNFLLYNWLDGAYLTDAAGAANIAISYSFAYHVAG